METTMTMNAFLTLVANGEINDDVKNFASERLTKNLSQNANHNSAKAKKYAEDNAPLFVKIHEALANGGLLTSEVATAIGVSTSKASSLLRKMSDNGEVTSEEVTIAKVGKRVKYTLAVDGE